MTNCFFYGKKYVIAMNVNGARRWRSARHLDRGRSILISGRFLGFNNHFEPHCVQLSK